VIVFGLARISDDEVAAERRLRLARANVGDAREKSLSVAPAAHATQVRLRHVLQREVEVRHTSRENRVDELVAEVARIEIQQPRARHLCRHGVHEIDDGARPEFVGSIFAVAREILGDEHDFFGLQFVDLAQDAGDVTAALRAAERRNRAEPARAVAAFGDLHVGPRCARRRTRQVEQVERRHGLRSDAERWLTTQRHRRRSCGVRRGRHARLDGHAETRDLVGLGQVCAQLVAVALSHAAGHHQPRTLLASLAEREHRVDAFFARIFDERAGVHDDDVGLRLVVGGRQALGEQRADELFGVDLVLGAPERLHIEVLRHASRLREWVAPAAALSGALPAAALSDATQDRRTPTAPPPHRRDPSA